MGNFNARIINRPFVLLQRRCENDPKNQALTLKVSSLDPYYENDIELVACFHSRHEDFILAQGGVNHPWVPRKMDGNANDEVCGILFFCFDTVDHHVKSRAYP